MSLSVERKLRCMRGDFTKMLWRLVSSSVHISGILESNTTALTDQCSSSAETNIEICNNLFDCFEGMNTEAVDNFLRSKLRDSDHEALCRHPLEAVCHSGSIFQKICRINEPDKTQKAIDELYRLCILLLNPGAKPEMFTLKCPEDESMVLLHLIAIFEHSPLKLEAFLKDCDKILARIAERAISLEHGFALLYLLLKTLSLDSNIKESITMHIVSLGLQKIDNQSYDGDLSRNLYTLFYRETFSELQQTILCNDEGRWKISPSYSLKDAPYIDPEQFMSNKRGDKIFKHFLRVIELSFSTPANLRSVTSVLSCLIMVYPRIVILLAKLFPESLHPDANQPLSTSQQNENIALSTPKNTKFLNSLLQALLENNAQVALEILVNALINPHTQSELILYKGELIPTVTYHRCLLVDWLIKNFQELNFANCQPDFDEKLSNLVPMVKLVFRDAHLMTPRDIELYYAILDKFVGLQMMTIHLASYLEPFRDIQLALMASELLSLSPTELLYNFNFVLMKKIQDFLYYKMNSKLFLQSSIDPPSFIEEKKTKETYKTNSLNGKPSATEFSHKFGSYNLSKLFFESKLVNGHLLNERIKQKSGLHLFNTEIQFLLSKMPVELSDISSLSNESSDPIDGTDDYNGLCQKNLQVSKEFLDELRKSSKDFVGGMERISASASFAVDFQLEDLISGTQAPQEIIELARDVNIRFRKFVEPIFEKTFVSHLLNREIYWNIHTKDIESEINRFLSTLSKKEYIAFMLCTDEETFRKQPKRIQTILRGLRDKAKNLLSQKSSYENTEEQNRTLIAQLTNKTAAQMKVEKLLSVEMDRTKQNETDLLDKLEYLMTGKLNYNVSSVLKSKMYNLESNSMRLESIRMCKHSLDIFGVINKFFDRICGEVSPKILSKVPPLPNSFMEKIFALSCLSILEDTGLLEILKILMFNPYDEIRILDLVLHVLSIPDESMHSFMKSLEDHFKLSIKRDHGEISAEIKYVLSKLITKLFAYRSREITFLADFKPLVDKIEQEIGVIPQKKELISTGLTNFQYTKGRSFVQEWLSIASKFNIKDDERGQATIPLLIQYFNFQTASVVEEDGSTEQFFKLFDSPEHFCTNSYHLSDMHLYLALKNPRVLEITLQACNSSKSYEEKITQLSKFADKLNSHLKICICDKASFSLKGLDAKEFNNSIEDINFFTDKFVLCIRYFQEVVERLADSKSYSKTHLLSIIRCNKQLKSFLEQPILNKLQNNFVGHLERLEQILVSEAGAEFEDGDGLKLINAICAYVITFYKIHKVQEELEHVISLGQEVYSPALVKIKSKDDIDQIDVPLLRLDRSMSVAYKERPFDLDEVMFRLASKCSKLFKCFINCQQQDYFIITMAPWVIPQGVRLEFLRDNLQAVNENSITKKFYLRRDSILEDTLSNFDALNPAELTYKLKLNIEFIGEAGVDQGGLTTEWISKLLKILLDPAAGLFHLSANKISLQPSPSSAIIPEYHKYYRLVGRIIGYVIANRIAVNVNFTKPMLKQLLGVTLNAFDIADVDPDLSNSLQWMLDNNVSPEEIMQEFSFEFNFLDKFYTIDLSQDHANQEVSEENKRLFVKLLIYHKLVKSIEIPLSEIYNGITEFVPSLFLKMLTPVDLNSILAGESTINIAEMKQHAKINDPSPSPEVVEWLWEILEEIEKDQLAAFLFFVTGNSVVGFGGFKEHPIVISRSFAPHESLPSVHTCFSMIDIPEYFCKEVMKEKLLKAVLEGQGFYLA